MLIEKVIKMYKLVYTICGIIITISSVAGEHEFFRDIRRTKPNPVGHAQMIQYARVAPEILKSIIDEKARRRFQEQLHRFQLNRNILQRELEDAVRPAFTYQLPLKNNEDLDKPIVFAVGPSDPRFYDQITAFNSENADTVYDPYSSKNMAQHYAHQNPNVNLPPSPQDIKPNPPIYHNQQPPLDNKFNEERVDEDVLPHRVNGVIQRPVEIDGAMAMYIVALIGGISAAVTVGLISVGIGWYTLHKKAKAAADVDYPAYGVTGPNKDSSPIGDRRLAQSAQMYHYQHQKQQIIAMENHNNVEKNGSHSDAESEDDNEEGDYTVYECPGLAPTGEMEVKNPLFLDDAALTPGSTPASNTNNADANILNEKNHHASLEDKQSHPKK